MLTVMTGRSRRLWPQVLREVGEAYAQGGQRLLVITPDQYTLQAELDLVDKLNIPGLLQIEVLSPSRLVTRVFSLAGSPQRIRIDTRGKSMMLTDVLRASREELKYYGGAALRRGFAERLASGIGDFKRAGKTPEDVRQEAEKITEGDALRDKLSDIALVFERYEERLQGAFIDGEDVQEALLERLPRSGLLNGAQIWIYGFDMLAPQFIRQIAVMAKAAVSVRVALTCEGKDARDGAVYAAVRESIDILGRMMDQERMLWDEVHITAPLEAAPEIQHLEAELYAMPPVIYGEDTIGHVHLAVAPSPYEETMQVAEQMLSYARAGVRFEDMAVVIGSVEEYTGAVEMVFDRSGIPYHLARKRPALAHPLIRTWLAAIRTVTIQWRQIEDVLEWLKGGFCGLTVEEAERLENYAIEHGLKGVKWQRTIEDVELEAIRERFVAPLEAMRQRLRQAKDNTASLAAVYRLLEDVDAYATLTAWQDTLIARGMLTPAAECSKAWRLLLETLDQLHALLRGSRMRMDGMAQVIEAGFTSVELGTVPPKPGVVQVGELGHAKTGGNCRVLFLLGMHDGVMQQEASSLLSDQEVSRLGEGSRMLGAFGMRSDTLAQMTQINLLDTVSAPSEHLHISHAVASASGDAQRPATVLKLVRRVFPGLKEEGSAVEKKIPAFAPGIALDAFGAMLRRAAAREDGSLTPEEMEVAAWLLHSPQTRSQADDVLRTFSAPPPVQRLEKRTADGIYAHTRTSVSRLESFANCPFRHFVSYGLRPVPRREFEVARSETGTFYHQAMEGYTQAAMAQKNWPELSREESDRLMDSVLEPLRGQWEEAPLGDNAMMRATGDAFCRVARRAAWNFTGQMQRGAFRPGQVEARFGPGEALAPVQLRLPDGRVCWVEGRIDRIDYYEEDGETWLRIVDYKSGGTTIDLSKVYGGLQLQLLMYLSAALAAHPEIAPAGAFYSRFDDPYVETDSRDVAEIEKLLAEKLRLKGIWLSDVRVIRAMDDERLIKKDGEVRKSNDIMTGEEMGALMGYVHTVAGQIAGQIAQGEIAARPARLGQWTACSWCDYRSICGFDPTREGHVARVVEKVDRKEVMRRLGVESESEE